jgi:drug/metabolite transporter (DMT)-like permease
VAFGAVWTPVALPASSARTLRNAMQRDLIRALGAVGAAHARFPFGLPFAAMFLVGVMAAIEAPMAQVVSLRMFREPPSLREAFGMTLIVAAASDPCLDGGVRRRGKRD